MTEEKLSALVDCTSTTLFSPCAAVSTGLVTAVPLMLGRGVRAIGLGGGLDRVFHGGILLMMKRTARRSVPDQPFGEAPPFRSAGASRSSAAAGITSTFG